VTTENGVDGFAMLNLEEHDICTMLPGKVGFLRKIITLIQPLKQVREIGPFNWSLSTHHQPTMSYSALLAADSMMDVSGVYAHLNPFHQVGYNSPTISSQVSLSNFRTRG